MLRSYGPFAVPEKRYLKVLRRCHTSRASTPQQCTCMQTARTIMPTIWMMSRHDNSIITALMTCRLARSQHFTTCGDGRSEVRGASDSMHAVGAAAVLSHLGELVVSCGHRVGRWSGQQACLV